MKKVPKVLLLIYLTLSLAGCWDKVEIEDRAYINVIGYDEYNEEFYEEAKKREDGKIRVPELGEDNRFVITYSFPNLRAIGKNATSDEARFVVSSVGSSPYQVTTLFTTRVNKVVFFKHTRVLIIGEDVAKNSEYMKEIIDNILRHEQLSRKVYLLIAEGTAKDIIAVEDIFEPNTGFLLSELFTTGQRSARYFPQTFHEFAIDLRNNEGSALLPRVSAGKEEVKTAGSAIIKGYKLVGWLGELETRAVSFVNDKVKGEAIDVEMDEVPIPFVITNSRTKKSSKVSEEQATIDVNIELEGYLQQYKTGDDTRLLDEKALKLIEKMVNEKLKEQIEGTIKKLQKEFKVDVIAMGEYLSKFEPDYWETVKDDWNNKFSDLQINVSLDAKVRRIGMVK